MPPIKDAIVRIKLDPSKALADLDKLEAAYRKLAGLERDQQRESVTGGTGAIGPTKGGRGARSPFAQAFLAAGEGHFTQAALQVGGAAGRGAEAATGEFGKGVAQAASLAIIVAAASQILLPLVGGVVEKVLKETPFESFGKTIVDGILASSDFISALEAKVKSIIPAAVQTEQMVKAQALLGVTPDASVFTNLRKIAEAQARLEQYTRKRTPYSIGEAIGEAVKGGPQ